MARIGDKENHHPQQDPETKQQERATEREEALQLVRKLGAAYTEYKKFLEAHPDLSPQPAGGQTPDLLFYEELRQNLEHADDAPRCSHIKADGIPCRSPRMKTGERCYAHQRMAKARPAAFRLPAYEDANSIQMGLMEVGRALLDREISERTAGLLFYSLQIAVSNVHRLTFHQAPGEMVVEEPAPPPADEPAPSIYEQLDEDLKLKLLEITDEFDRRVREKHERAKTVDGAAIEPIADETRRLACPPTATNCRDEGETSTADHVNEHRGPLLIMRAETGFGAESDPVATVERWGGGSDAKHTGKRKSLSENI